MTTSTSDPKDTPLSLFTIQEVSQRTGVQPATLRVWQRRYGVPTPQRSDGNFRLYSGRDIADVRAMVRRCREGLRPRQAAFLVLRGRRLGAISSPFAAAMRLRLEDACLNFDESAAEAVINEAARQCEGPGLLRDLVWPVVAAIGEGREAGAITISQEHFASQLARRIALGEIARLRRRRSTAPSVLIACGPGEQHELGLLLLACELEQREIGVTYLGAAVPPASFLAAAASMRIRLGVIGVTMPSALDGWRTHVARLRDDGAPVIVWAGPAAVSAAGWPGLTALTVDEAISKVEESLTARPRQRRSPGLHRGLR